MFDEVAQHRAPSDHIDRSRRIGIGFHCIRLFSEVVIVQRCTPDALRQPIAILPPLYLSFRFTAGAFGFLLLVQCGERPELYAEPRRFDTIPSRPSLPASRAVA
jgi:hypothetical protein